LLKSNYSVLTADSPEKAVEVAKEYKDEIQLLITDVVMPGMNGKELSEKIKKLYPNMKVLFMSGYTANVIAHKGILENV
ncbi:MAG TPA: hybrid sensor histidine kinase/response regulator, partial [Flexistipes sinusarabici]|nr:hybrid sensor histidine kinase/response regulator [Flexistipes sinusarabici]